MEKIELLAGMLPEQAANWWRKAEMWTLMYRGGLLAGVSGIGAFILWRIVTANRERERLEALVASRTRQFQQSEELFRSIFEHAAEGIFQSSLDGRHLRANPAMARICRCASPEEMRRTYTDAATQFYVQPGRRDEINAQVADKGFAVDCESEIRRKDGSTIWIAENVRTVVDPATGDTVYQGSLVDITARREMQAAQEQARAAAEAANLAKSGFLAHMTHELRTPLTGILSSARIALRDPGLDERNRDRYTLIADSGEHLLQLVDEVLDLSRIEAGRMELREGPLNLSELLRTVMEGFQNRAADAALELRCEADPALPLNVRGDTLRLRQVLENLVGNALKFTDRGHVMLGVQPATSPRILFEVTDTGIGIPSDQKASIFQPFQQAPVPGRPTLPGAGLGLNISSRLVCLMGGQLKVESTPGQGSRFFFEIPLPAADGSQTLRDAKTGPDATTARTPVSPQSSVLPPDAELDALLDLSLGGDIVRLRARLDKLAASDSGHGEFARDLHRLAAGFRMNAISEFIESARQSRRKERSANGEAASHR